jgi:hypothetical protein
MRIILLDRDGREVDQAKVADSTEAPYQGMRVLARQSRIDAGCVLCFDDGAKPEPDTLMTVSAGTLGGLATRLEQRAGVIAVSQPLSAQDLVLAARLCRHALKARWVTTTVAI